MALDITVVINTAINAVVTGLSTTIGVWLAGRLVISHIERNEKKNRSDKNG